MRDYLGESIYPCQDVIGAAQTAQILGVAPNTFDIPIQFLLVLYADLACYIAKDDTEIDLAAVGQQNGRCYIPAAAGNILIPWSGADVWFLNAVTDETPTLHVVGIV